MRGFTTLELVITLAIVTVVMIALSYLYIVDTRVITLQNSAIQVAHGASSVFDAARDAALQADHVVATHTYGGVLYTSSATTTIFEVPTIDSSGAIVASTYDYIGIYATGTKVYRFIDANANSARKSGTTLLTSALKTLLITYSSSTFTQVASTTFDATTSASYAGNSASTHLFETFTLRNL